MKNGLRLFICTVIASLTVYGCKESVKPTQDRLIFYEPTAAPVKAPDIEAYLKKAKTSKQRTISQLTLVLIHPNWITKLGGQDKTLAFFKSACDVVAASDVKYGYDDKFIFEFAKVGEFDATRDPLTLKTFLAQKRPRFAADNIILAVPSTRGGVNALRSAGYQGSNYGVVCVYDAASLIFTIYHEGLGHGNGVDHNHLPIWNFDGLFNQYIENYGQVYFPNFVGKMPAGVTPKLTTKYLLMGYAFSAGKPYDLEFHPAQVIVRRAFMEKAPLDCWNNAYDISYSGGSVTYKDDDNGQHSYRVMTYGTNGNGTFSTWNEVSSAPADQILVGSQYTSGTVGIRYDFPAGTEKITFDPPADASKYNISWWKGATSMTGALPLPARNVLTVKPGATRLQVRPLQLATPQISGVRIASDVAGNTFRPTLSANKIYKIDISGKCTTANLQDIWVQTLPPITYTDGVPNSFTIAIGGALNSKYESSVKCFIEPIALPGYKVRLTFPSFLSYDIKDILTVNGVQYYYGKKPGVIEADRIDWTWVTDGSGTDKSPAAKIEFIKL